MMYLVTLFPGIFLKIFFLELSFIVVLQGMPSCYNPTLLLNLTSKSVSLLQETCAPCATECSTF